MKKLAVAVAMIAVLGVACQDDADVASHNISKAADNFEVMRRIVFFNGITDTYLLTIEGRCSIEDEGKQLEVTCKVEDSENDDEDAFKKHFLGLSDNVSYFVEQGDPINVDVYHYRVTFKPETIVPDIDFRSSGEDQ